MKRYGSRQSAVLIAATLVGGSRLSAQPELVGHGTISTAAVEFAITFSTDGREAYFNRASDNRDTLVIMVSRWTPQGWGPATIAPFSGRYRDVDPFITPDGTRLFFSSDRPRLGEAGRSLNTWYLERTAQGWSNPIDAGTPLNTDSTEVFVSLSRQDELAMSSNRHGTSRVYLAARREGHWTEPAPVTFGTVTDGGNPLLHPSGRAMIVVRAGPDDRADLYVSCRTLSDAWSEPLRLPHVNSRWADFAPAFDQEARYLYFTSERPGVVPGPIQGRPPGDIYRIPVERLGVPCLTQR